MENKNKKSLTLMDVIEKSNVYTGSSNTKEITVLEDYTLKIHPLISANNMKNIFSDFGNWIQDKNVQQLLGDKPIGQYVMCFVVKHQTELFEQIGYEHTNVDLYNIFNILMNSYALEEIISHIDKKSIEMVLLRLNDVLKVAEQVAKVNDIKKNKGKKTKK